MANLDFVDTIGSNSLSYIQSKLLGVALGGVRNVVSLINNKRAYEDFLWFADEMTIDNEEMEAYKPYYLLALQWRDEGVPTKEIENRLKAMVEAAKKI
jgi:hypothetical protein